MENLKKISICFAVYNNEGSLTILYNNIVKIFEIYFPKYILELIFVNDGSKDNSLQEIKNIKETTNDNRIKIISFSRNFGQIPAIIAGWENATGDCVINMAADLQDPPEQCIAMIKEWEIGNDIVISYRNSHKTSFFRKITSKIFYSLLLPKAPPGGFDFALIDRKPMDVINSLKEYNRFYQFEILWVGFNVKYIPYDKQERQIGKSQYNFMKRFGNFYSAFLNVSYLPLRLLSMIGAIVALSGFAYAIDIVWAYFSHKTPFQGWAPIMILILIIGGLIMLMIGLLGEYIWRILDEVKGRPKYIIKDIL
jgi:dolichol-phosphate mannosyltransferase